MQLLQWLVEHVLAHELCHHVLQQALDLVIVRPCPRALATCPGGAECAEELLERGVFVCGGRGLLQDSVKCGVVEGECGIRVSVHSRP